MSELQSDEQTVIRLLLQGRTYREIGKQLRKERRDVRVVARRAFRHLSSLASEARIDAGLEGAYSLLADRFDSLRGSSAKQPISGDSSETIREMPSQARSSILDGHPPYVRVNELARELKLPSKAIVKILPELGVIEKKTHSSGLAYDIAIRVSNYFNKQMRSEDDSTRQRVNEEYIGLALFEGRFRIVELRPDGTYKYVSALGNFHDLFYTVGSNTKALKEAVEELEDLLNARTAKEADFQQFFENHPSFIMTDDHVEARADVLLTREGAETLKPDFMLRPLDVQRTSDILELKLPTAKVYVEKPRRERLSQAVMEARAQLLEYSRYFDEARQRESIQAKYGIFAYRPRMFVVIGRRGTVNPVIRRNAESTADDLQLRTYDDILDRMKQKIKLMQMGTSKLRETH